LRGVPERFRAGRSNLNDLEYEQGMPYSDILRLAMKREEKALSLYSELAEKTDEGSLTKVFKMLC
jgi:rubrerythrin